MFNQDSAQADPKKVFLGNLPWSLTEDKLREMCAEFGEVTECRLPLDQANRSRGIAFITFAEANQASAAIQGLENREIDGRNIHASPARPRQNRQPN